MRPDLETRRRTLWERLEIDNDPQHEVVSDLAEEYDVSEGTIRDDINSIEEWLPKLYNSQETSGISALLTLQSNRRRLQKMAAEAREEGALDLELKIRQEITRTIKREQQLSQDVTLHTSSSKIDQMLNDPWE